MADGFKAIPRCVPGGVSLVSSDYANQLIDVINAIGGGTVSPIANVGKMMLAPPAFILDLAPFDARLRAVEGLVYGPAGNNTESLENRISNIENNVTILQDNIVTITNRLDNADIIANGTCSGNNIAINISLNI